MEQDPQIGRKGAAAGRPLDHLKRVPRMKDRMPGRAMHRAFFELSPDFVAPRLLGKILAHRTPSGVLAGRIVEVEAYLGPHHKPPDPAAHSFRGPTPRNRILFGAAAHAYVYAIYGRYFCMNVTCEVEGQAGCLLLRALEPITNLDQMAFNRGIPTGSQALGLTRAAHDSLDLLDPESPLQLREDRFPVDEVLVTPRIGIRHAVDWPLRFALPDHICVSGPKHWNKPPVGKRIFLG
jgi:DNA-3-methyladenine glycosylase